MRGLPHWGNTFWDHVDVARELPRDSRGLHPRASPVRGLSETVGGWTSGAMRMPARRGPGTRMPPCARLQIQARHPDLRVRAFLMDPLRGSDRTGD